MSSTLELRHYAAEPLVLDREREYDQRDAYKPKGLWVSVPGEDDWPSWCRSEDFALDSLTVDHEVTLTPDARILHLAGAGDLDGFFDSYGHAPSYPTDTWREAVYWENVAKAYDGIVITPYVWERRLDAHWYYGWDCASGCIWNLDAIAAIAVRQPA